MRFLFVKSELCWPRVSGHDVHSYQMMQSLISAGHDVALLTLVQPQDKAISGLRLIDQRTMPSSTVRRPDTSKLSNRQIPSNGKEVQWSWRQERFRRYWGIEKEDIRFTRKHAEELGIDAVVVVGIEVLPYLLALKEQKRIWYAADEWVWHHLSLFKLTRPDTWQHVKRAIVMGAYEHTFSNVVDRAWMVSASDQRALQWVTSIDAVDLIPNGVDAEIFSPTKEPVNDRTCTFWGNLGFIPNEQALSWFCSEVWPLVISTNPDAKFTIYGFNPSEKVRRLKALTGVNLVPDVPDIRLAVSQQAVVVLPFQSGGGIKNKMLEAAALSKPILCSSRACNGLNGADELPFLVLPAQPQQWAQALIELWENPNQCEHLGATARNWVLKNHSWDTAAQKAVAGITDNLVVKDGPAVTSL